MHRFISAIRRRRRGAWRDRRGAVAVEFAFLFPIALVFTFGLIEFALILFDFHRLSEATRRGARAAIIQSAVADLTGLTSNTITCTGTGVITTDYGVTCSTSVDDAAAFQTIIEDMQGIKPELTGSNVTITYTDTGVTGGASTPGLMTPMVTVQVTGFQYTYFLLTMADELLSITGSTGQTLSSTTFSFPDFATSRVGPTQNAT